MDKDYLTLKRAPIGPNEEDYDVLFDSVLVGRIVLSPFARNDRQWMWSLDHRDRTPRTATNLRARPLCRLSPRVGTVRREAEEDWGNAR
jgi:hypothetical protein